MNSILVVGHKNPDTDSICSAIAYAKFKKTLGVQAEPVAIGEINEETRFALTYFHVSQPRFLQALAPEAAQVILVDHNERQQSADDIDQVEVIEVIDHHRIANFQTSNPLYYRAEPVGCTATIIYKVFQEHDVPISKNTAGLLVSAIISDTLLLISPTCTREDVEAAQKLATIAEVDLKDYGLQLLKAGANVRDHSITALLSSDAKDFAMGSSKVRIAQVNVVDPLDVLYRQQELEAQMADIIAKEKLDLFLFVITDIIKHESAVVALGEAAHAVEQAFHVALVDHQVVLKDVVSRKKQIVPVLDKLFYGS